jgi:co-chaperonin GroES (HSP10)
VLRGQPPSTEIKIGADEVLIMRVSDILAKVVGDRAAV